MPDASHTAATRAPSGLSSRLWISDAISEVLQPYTSCCQVARTLYSLSIAVLSIAPLQALLYSFASWCGWCVSGAWATRALISIGQVQVVPSITNCFSKVFLLQFGVRCVRGTRRERTAQPRVCIYLHIYTHTEMTQLKSNWKFWHMCMSHTCAWGTRRERTAQARVYIYLSIYTYKHVYIYLYIYTCRDLSGSHTKTKSGLKGLPHVSHMCMRDSTRENDTGSFVYVCIYLHIQIHDTAEIRVSLRHTATHTATRTATHCNTHSSTYCNTHSITHSLERGCIWALLSYHGTHCNTHCNTHSSTHRNAHCNTHCSTHCSTHCNTHCSTHCNTHCNTLLSPHEIFNLVQR